MIWPFSRKRKPVHVGPTSAEVASSWQLKEGFAMVINPMRGGFAEGFQYDALNTFDRAEWDSPAEFKLSDTGPLYNVGGLYYLADRKVTKTKPAEEVV